ncbi:hypothetical protein [Paenibacillus thalictri]|uniref:Uncharacterized protein n=1 Tax=Paenibacillus thalictri TaxID=2527873 RepID=A0A4Q9DGT1_9BACL|nr:hypothetical protein [Paenibacillus thalictri]TBL69780.1 hypothetical protein EYB31_34975 [Paenibacillus thalictri]
MSAELRINIQGKNPPVWAIGDQSGSYFSYYENEHGEQWVAKIDDGFLRISGIELEWEQLQLTVEEAIAENNRIVDQIVAGTLMQSKDIPESVGKAYLEIAESHRRGYQGELPLAHLIFGSGELLWLASVLNTAISRMK